MYTKMDPGLKKLWVDALRSGKYKQTKYCLTDDYDKPTCFCATGLLCLVSNGPWGYGWLNAVTSGRAQYVMHLNDDLGWSFPEIADWVEENL